MTARPRSQKGRRTCRLHSAAAEKLVQKAYAAGWRPSSFIGCFDEHRLEPSALRWSPCPVDRDRAGAAYDRAAQLGRFSVVNDTRRLDPVLEGNIAALGLDPAIARACAPAVYRYWTLNIDSRHRHSRVLAEARQGGAPEDGISAIVSGLRGLVDVAGQRRLISLARDRRPARRALERTMANDRPRYGRPTSGRGRYLERSMVPDSGRLRQVCFADL